mmetsp:Transcript_24948/g.18843  ORF Transcript_24948/g.18843 Transcript_24948/m.18843 type:complete len:125 (+) Transcript_24948:26-400(+)
MPPKKETTPAQKLKVQVNVCKRLQKEVASYEKEVIANEAKVQKMKDDGKDEYDIRKQEEVLQESYMMIPDSKSRLETAFGELTELWEEFQSDESVNEELRQEISTILGLESATESQQNASSESV